MKFNDKTLKSKKIYQGKTLDLELRSLKNENGLVYEREIIKRKDAIAIVATFDDKVIMVKQYRAPVEAPLLELPAGIVEDNNPEKTAHKELIEEAGYKAYSLEFLAKYYVSPGYTDEVVTIYKAGALKKVKPQPEEEEILDIILLPVKEALQQIKTGKITDSKTIIGLLMAYEN